ncbi:hypothetical protein LCGC14_1704550 [marine sediment metagenome]|uniref:DNA polymerase beta thumb domain-containing protein n=1 Tax=marine sediment metagenome TaxID=412755 RepID=A0A0F9JXI3_9ZZZZ
MELAQAQKTADSAVERFRPSCTKIEVAGSVRRRRPFVNDIDIVLIPTDRYALDRVLMEMAVEFTGSPKLKIAGPKIARVLYRGIYLDIYYATAETFPTLLLIRTGSRRHNVSLAFRAKDKGWRLHASGDGLFDADDQRIAGDTEESIFETLGLPYKAPEKRE